MVKGLFEGEVLIGDEKSPLAKLEAKKLFQEAYQAQTENNYGQAIELYLRSIETFPTAEAHTFLGWVYSFQDRYDEAIAECREALRLNPALAHAWKVLGTALRKKKDLVGAIAAHREALPGAVAVAADRDFAHPGQGEHDRPLRPDRDAGRVARPATDVAQLVEQAVGQQVRFRVADDGDWHFAQGIGQQVPPVDIRQAGRRPPAERRQAGNICSGQN